MAKDGLLRYGFSEKNRWIHDFLYDLDRFMEGPHPCVLDVLYEPYYVLLVQNPNPLKLGAEEL